MNLFFIQPKNNQEASLNEEESRHCMKVLRHKIGDEIHGIDGAGNYYKATIVGWEKKSITLSILSQEEDWGEKGPQISLGLSPLRTKDRYEWSVEKAIELGINAIHPIVCKRTVKPNIKEKRIEGIAKSALKQSKRSRMPLLATPIPFSEWVAAEFSGLKLIPWMEGEHSLSSLSATIEQAQHIRILVGPEGGFTPEEIELAVSYGYIPITLGTNRLRAETAAIHCLSAIKMIQGW